MESQNHAFQALMGYCDTFCHDCQAFPCSDAKTILLLFDWNLSPLKNWLTQFISISHAIQDNMEKKVIGDETPFWCVFPHKKCCNGQTHAELLRILQ